MEKESKASSESKAWPGSNGSPGEEKEISSKNKTPSPPSEEEEDSSHLVKEPRGEEELNLRSALEAMLFISGEMVTADRFQRALSDAGYKFSQEEIEGELQSLKEKYLYRDGGILMEEVAGGYRFVTPTYLAPVLVKFQEEKRRQRLSDAAVETLAIIAYKQPLTRSDIESIRGVAVGNIVRNLTELGLVEVVGRSKEQHGAYIYATTQKFLESFGLSSLDDLPQRE